MLLNTAHNSLHASNKFLMVIRLTNVIIRSNAKTAQPGFNRILSCDENEWDLIPFFTQLSREIETVQIWHRYVENKQIGLTLLDHLKCAARVISRLDFITLLAKDKLHQRILKSIIIDDKDIHCLFPFFCSLICTLSWEDPGMTPSFLFAVEIQQGKSIRHKTLVPLEQ